jgi:hypothetical protein
MAKLILLSIILVNTGVPIWLSQRASPRRNLRYAVLLTTLFVVVWAYMCLKIYPQLVPLD